MKWVALLFVAGCASKVVVGDATALVADLPATPNPDLDILFVVDNSPSMADKQQSLAANFPHMMDVLASLDAGLPNLHVGVVSSDMGTLTAGGQAGDIGVPGQSGRCGGAGDAGALRNGYLEDLAGPSGTRMRNYTGELRDAFATNAQLGDAGCGFEQHLRAMRTALDPATTANAGFLRPSANLAIVLLADEDDCSVQSPDFFGTDPALGALDSYRCTRFGVICDGDDPTNPHTDQQHCRPRADSTLVDDVQPYLDAVAAAKPDPAMVLVSTIAGPTNPFSTSPAPQTSAVELAPSCTFTDLGGAQAVAAPGVRLAAFADAFPGRSTQTSICDADLSGALTQIGASAKRLVGDPCLADQPIPDTCAVTHVAPSGQTTALPACSDAAGQTCFELVDDPTACAYTPTHLRLRLDAPPAEGRFEVRCATTATE